MKQPGDSSSRQKAENCLCDGLHRIRGQSLFRSRLWISFETGDKEENSGSGGGCQNLPGGRTGKSPLLEFSTKSGLIFLHPEEIYFFEFSGRRIFITARDGTYEMGGRLKDVRDRMEEYGFASPHKSFVVNLGEIKNMRGYEIYMTNGTVIPLAQKQSPLFKEVLSKYLAGRRK